MERYSVVNVTVSPRNLTKSAASFLCDWIAPAPNQSVSVVQWPDVSQGPTRLTNDMHAHVCVCVCVCEKG